MNIYFYYEQINHLKLIEMQDLISLVTGTEMTLHDAFETNADYIILILDYNFCNVVTDLV